jgi:hypothetical protein
LVLIGAILSTAGCASGPLRIPATGEEVLLPKTAAYDERVRSFRLTPTEAGERVYPAQHGEDVRAGRATESPATRAARPGAWKGPPAGPTAVVNRSYVFSFPYDEGARLDGWYIDGDTGEARYRDRESFPYYVEFRLIGGARICRW